jgi:long-chain acyl-CoA synthetase
MHITQTLTRARLLYGDQPGLLDGDLTMTYNEFGQRVEKLAGAFQALGIGPDDKVAVLMLNSYRYLEVFYATFWSGGVVVPLNIRLAPPEISHQLNEAEVKILIVDDTFAMMLPGLKDHLTHVQHVVVARDGAPTEGMLDYEQLLREADPVEDALREGDDVAGIFYTGGTTGRAKGVMLTHDNVMANTQNTLMSNQSRSHDIYLHSAPMFHLADCSGTFAVTLVGAKHAFIPYFDPVKVMEAIQKHKVTLGLMIPTMMNMILNHPQRKDYDLSSLRVISYGAAPMPLALLERSLAELPCDYIQGYGMTELSPLIVMLPPRDHVVDGTEKQQKRLKSAGIPIFTAEVKVFDKNGQEVPRGEVGEICARGPMVMKGYWKQPEATAEALRSGWMHTGDAGYMDEDGYLFLVDRTKDMIVTGGENVYSVEVESALYDHPAVFEAAVIGVPDDTWGEAVHAVIYLKPDQSATQEELIHHCHSRIANYKCPKSVSFSEVELPKSGAGKILKRELRAPYWGDSERQIN